jgi:hypothetical protein
MSILSVSAAIHAQVILGSIAGTIVEDTQDQQATLC